MQGNSLAGCVPAELRLWTFPRSVLGSIWKALSGRLTCSFSFLMPVDSADPLHLAVVLLLTQKQSVAWGGGGAERESRAVRRLAGVLE